MTHTYTYTTLVICDVQLSLADPATLFVEKVLFTGTAPNYMTSIVSPPSLFLDPGVCKLVRYEIWEDPGTGFVNVTDLNKAIINSTDFLFTTGI